MANREAGGATTSDAAKRRESLLETLESIVVAFVLAFIFRAFIVEAFVIPTGSMAPTLHGAHYEFECASCGYEFSAGADPTSRHDAGWRSPTWYCPNCFHPRQLQPGETAFSGDRILVLKFLYDFQDPRRWDVIVFRNPNEPSQNYIKRLVGLPGDTVEVRQGDVTINGRIVQKTDAAQEALWMIVHDTRYRPTYTTWVPRWKLEGGWEEAGHGFRLSEGGPAAAGSGPPGRAEAAWLTYEHRIPRGQGDDVGAAEPSNILDYYAYNAPSALQAEANACTDLALRGRVKAGSAQASVVIELGAYNNRLRFELPAVGSGRPARVLVNGQVVAEGTDGALPVGRAVEVLAANVDHKAMLLVDGRRVATCPAEARTREGDPVYEPLPLAPEERDAMDRAPGRAASVRLGASGGPVAVEYLGLWRDVYYTNAAFMPAGERGHATAGNPETLGADEFFVLGDNSPNSLDSRLWRLDRPVVPRRNLVGKAFFVYWPAAGSRLYIPIAPDPTGFRFVH